MPGVGSASAPELLLQLPSNCPTEAFPPRPPRKVAAIDICVFCRGKPISAEDKNFWKMCAPRPQQCTVSPAKPRAIALDLLGTIYPSFGFILPVPYPNLTAVASVSLPKMRSLKIPRCSSRHDHPIGAFPFPGQRCPLRIQGPEVRSLGEGWGKKHGMSQARPVAACHVRSSILSLRAAVLPGLSAQQDPSPCRYSHSFSPFILGQDAGSQKSGGRRACRRCL